MNLKTVLIALVLASLPSVSWASVIFSIPRYEPTRQEVEVVAACLVLEAANQGVLGMTAVMAVINNRANNCPSAYYAVVVRPGHFSAMNAASSNRVRMSDLVAKAKKDRAWLRALAVVSLAVDGSLIDPTGGATFYTVRGLKPYWLRDVSYSRTIGDHTFYLARRRW